MSKKDTTKRTGAKAQTRVPATLRRRAEQIINNPKAYDADTRRTVERALAAGDPDHLRSTVCMAEDPEVITMLDSTGHEDEPQTSADLRRQLAKDLASILRNPECPATLYNDLADSITAMSADLKDDFWHSAEQIERSLNAHIRREAARRGER